MINKRTFHLKIIPVDLYNQLAVCKKFRKDAHRVSFGSIKDFEEEDILNWFRFLQNNNPSGFQHVYFGEEIIGQLEFRLAYIEDDGITRGYIYLLYLIEGYRGKGFGQKIHDYVLNCFKKDGCVRANLRCFPNNKKAYNFYLKNEWYCVDEPTVRGQLMEKLLF